MPDLDPLKFQVAIEDQVTGELNKIEQKLKGLKDQTINVDVKGLDSLDRLLKSIGHNSDGLTIKLPDLSQFTEQIKSVKATTESLFSKQNWSDIPAFTTALSQIKELSAAVDKLKHDNLAVNTGNGTEFFNKLQQMGTSIAAAFQEIPNVKIQSMTAYMKQFEQEFNGFIERLNKRGMANFSADSQQQIERLQRQFNQLNSIGGDSSALKIFQQQVRTVAAIITESIGNVIKEIGGVKSAIQHDNFSAFTTRIDSAAQAMERLTDAFGKFNLTVGKDEGLKNFMTGLGEVIRNVRNTMGQIEGGRNSLGRNQTDIYVKNVQKMEDALYRIQEARAKVGNAIKQAETTGMHGVGNMKIYMQMLDAYEKKLQNIRSNPLMMHENGWQTEALGTTFKHLLSNASDFQRQVDAYIQKQQTLETNQRRFNTMLEESEKLLNRLDASGTKGFNLGLDTSKNDKALKDIQAFIDKLLMFDSKNLGNNHMVSELIAEYQRLKTILSSVAREQEKLNTATEKANKKAADSNAKQQQKENDAWAESMRRAGVEATKLEIQVRKLQEAESRGKLANVDTTNLSARIAEMQNYITILRSIESGSRLHGHAGDLISSVPYQNSVRLATEEANAVNKSSAAKEKAAHATRQLSDEEQRLAQAIQNSTNSAKNQSQVISDLKGMMAQYLSVYGAQQFVTEMANITGELELQRKSLEVIIDNASTAQQLYGQIRDLSQMSPYTFQDLLKTTRQLAAFGIETKDLYSDMKALSDIGAGLNVDVSRLILAFGHTRAYGYLSGIQNRQFETAGIDLMGELVKFYNRKADEERARGNLAEYTNRKALYGRMRKRDIPFEDVQSVILGLDQPGGKFFNMQVRQFETLGGKLRNLRNNYNIMMSEMGASNHGVLTSGVAVLNELTENWSKYATILKDILIPLGAVKLAMLALNTATTQQAASLTAAATKKWRDQMIAQQQLSSGWRLFNGNTGGGFMQGWRSSRMNGNAMTPNFGQTMGFYRQMSAGLDNGQLSKQALRTMSLSKDLPQIYREAAGRLSGLNKEQAKYNSQLTGTNRQIAMLNQQVRNVGSRIGSFMGGMWSAIWNPATAVMALIGGITAVYQHIQNIKAQADAIAKSVKDTAQTDISGIDQILEEYSALTKNRKTTTNQIGGTTVTSTFFDVEEADFEGRRIGDVIDDLKRRLQAQSPMYDKDMFDLNKIENEVDQVEAMLNKLEDIRYAKQVEMANPEKIADAAVHTGFGNDTFGENAKDYQEAMRELESRITKVDEVTWNRISTADQEHIMQFGNDRATAIRNYLLSGGNDNIAGRLVGMIYPQNVRRAFRDLKDVSDGVIEQFLDALKNGFAERPEAFNAYFEDMMSKVFAEAKVDNPLVTNSIKNYLMGTIANSIENMNLSEETKARIQQKATEAYIANTVGSKFMSFVSPRINENTTQSDFLGIYKDGIRQLNVWLKSTEAAPEFRQWAVKNALLFYNSAKTEFERVTKRPEWQSSLLKIPEISASVKTVVTGSHTFDEMWDALLKKKKEAKSAIEKFNGDKSNWFQMNLGIKLQPKFENIDEILSKLKKVKDNLSNYTLGFGEREKARQLWEGGGEDIYNNLTLIKGITEGQNKDGISDKETTKNKGSKAYKDEFAKRWDERIRIMKEAYDWYDKWDKKVGNDSAIDEVNAKYQDIFKEWQTDKVLPMDFNVKEIADYYKYVEKIRDDALKRYQEQKNDKGKNNGQEALRVYRQAVALLNDIKFDNFTKAAEQFKSIIDKTIDDLNTRWDIYNNVREATGNEGMAFSVAGMGQTDIGARNAADAMKNQLKKSILDIGGEDMLNEVFFNTNIDTENIRKMFENIVPNNAKSKIDGLIQAYQEWQKLQKQVLKDDVKAFSSLIGSAVDLQSQVIKINDEYKKAIESLERLKASGNISESQYIQGKQIATANRDVKVIEANSSYRLLMDGVTTMSKKAAKQIKADYIDALTSALAAGAITAKDYADKISSINKKMRQLEDNPSNRRAYMQGGLNGLFENMMKKGQSMQEQGAQMYQDAERILDKSSDQQQIAQAFKDSDAGKSMMEMGQGMEQMGGQMMQTVAIIDMIVHGINNIVQGLKGTFDEIREMYDALGYDTNTDGWEDANAFFSSFSAASNSATKGWDSLKNGDVGGVIEGVVGSFTGWITGFAKAHDKKRQNHIDALMRNVKALDANTEAIKTFRDRTLGYDLGDNRRSVADQYAPDNAKASALGKYWFLPSYLREGYDTDFQKAMHQFYQENSVGTGYAQELENLKKKREDYIKMYEEEADKKKSSEEALLEYKQQIAELDDQIRYFTQDLAKELWSIDIKGWADQLSDALASAFENGENVAKAYKDTVTNILQQIMSKMMQLAIIEPMFQKLQDKLFGNAEKNIQGVFDADNPQESMSAVIDEVADFFGKGGEGEKTMTAAKEFLNAFQQGVSNAGLSVLNDTASTLSNGIQGTSEETSDLLAAYVNALRQDVAINRILITQFVVELWPQYIEEFGKAVTSLGNIDNNVRAIMEMMQYGRGAMYDEIQSLRQRFDNVVNGAEKVNIK